MQYLCFPSKLKHNFDGIPGVNFDFQCYLRKWLWPKTLIRRQS